MASQRKLDQAQPSRALDLHEKINIDKKIKFELDKMECKAIKLGGITNFISGLLVIWVLYEPIQFSLLISWYGVLVLINVINMLWASWFEYGHSTPSQLQSWRKIARFILAILCLTWGSIGILFVAPDWHYQFYILAFLLAVLIGFSFGTVTDFSGSLISITCLLVPSIIFHIYLGSQSILATGQDPNLHLAIGIMLFILGFFLTIACYLGNKWIKYSFKLSYENVALSHKLENMNKFLEQRVKERTIELEHSLKVVTYQATHDLLTKLPNQRLLLDYLQTAIKTATEKNNMFCVIFFTLNEIERINDGLGHQAGDLVIKTVAERLQKLFGAEKTVNSKKPNYIVTLTRKDVFVILLEPIYQLQEIEPLIESLFTVLDESIYTEQQIIKLTASIGVSIYPHNGRDKKTLLMNADAAMLRAKMQGGNTLKMYKSEINADISSQLEMEVNLHSAIKNNEFMIQYQPFVNLQTGEICGAEALVRWESPALGLISPADFIPLAEANGIIIPLGKWVLRTACMQAKEWHQLGFTSLKVAVNLSAKQLHQKNITQMIADILEETKLKPEYLELELTETEAFQEDVIPILKQFKEMGLSLSIDDFGTGYSGLSNLKLVSINKLKIDKSFVKDVVTNDDSRAIIANTITLGKKLQISVLAEGVENKDQLKFLQDNECDMIQGYYFSQPLNAEFLVIVDLQEQP